MVSLDQVLASNMQISTHLPKRVVAVFAGATSGIGEATLLAFVKYAFEPHIYLFARNMSSAERVIAQCRQLNAGGVYNFVKVDLSSVKETDAACEDVKKKEQVVNLVVLSAGEITFDTTRKLRTTQRLGDMLTIFSHARRPQQIPRCVNIHSHSNCSAAPPVLDCCSS